MKDTESPVISPPPPPVVWNYRRGEWSPADAAIAIIANCDAHACPRGYHLMETYGADGHIAVYERPDMPRNAAPPDAPRWIVDVSPCASHIESVAVADLPSLLMLLRELQVLLDLPGYAESIQRPEILARDEKASKFRLSRSA